LFLSTRKDEEDSNTLLLNYTGVAKIAGNSLAYSHELGVVLVDIIQKSVIINATLHDLHGGSLVNTGNRDISIQPYATSSILQHHYQASASATSASAFGGGNDFGTRSSANNQSSDNNATGAKQHQSKTDAPDHGQTGSSTATDISSNKSSFGPSDGSQVSYCTTPRLYPCAFA
jgi:hypothetical protein